jgi:hypothetical protein
VAQISSAALSQKFNKWHVQQAAPCYGIMRAPRNLKRSVAARTILMKHWLIKQQHYGKH